VQEIGRAFPGSARGCFLAGRLAYRQRRYEVAEERFRESQRLYSSPQTRYWLGKTLTQAGRFDEAESLLLEVRESNPWAWLVLGWLHERRNDLAAALSAYDEFLRRQPGNAYAEEQRIRVKAKMLDPETLIEEVQAMTDFGEPMPSAVFPEFVQGLFETGQTLRARDEISAGLDKLEAREAVQLAWICYRHQAFDLACTLFLAHLRANMFNFKYLAALEAAARKCNRLPQVLEAYHPLRPEARHLYGRCKRLS
jgi:tetratricopeptide (TPR) repeat protein